MRIGYGTSVTVPTQSERWYSKLNAGRAFARGSTVNAAVGNFSEAQLFNPLGSGKTITLYRASAALNVTDAIQFRIFNTALATLVGTGTNLQIGSAAGVGEYRTAQPAALDGSALFVVPAVASDGKDIGTLWFAELDAGEGIMLTTNAVNEQIFASFFWTED